MSQTMSMEDRALLQRAAHFIWAEADLLDSKSYDDWLALWTPDGHYVLPIGNGDDFENTLNLAYDDATMRMMRIERFKAGFSISSAPPAQTVRTLSRFVLAGMEGAELQIRCAQHLVEDKFGRQRLFAANVTYVLVRSGESFLIRDKIVRLLNSDGILTSISYLF
ncbi:aromatic-ring-hydroxylating dioxygenase subunit beta [Acidocella sp.]|uniref:aromatic-ring-hydroxylating dioxygenase subunit beta n=1 Tax=Acidocella sp. TaxID=50710 RepID=UPI003D0776B1